jgi:molybdate transport system regulatory protein
MYDFSIRLKVFIADADDKSGAFGPGTEELLLGIKELKSLNKSAARMGMAYSKAWKILKNTEKHLGFPLLTRDGPRGSALTPKGEEFLEFYKRLTDAATNATREILKEPVFVEIKTTR